MSNCLAALHLFEAMDQQSSIAQLSAVAAVGPRGAEDHWARHRRTLKMMPSS